MCATRKTVLGAILCLNAIGVHALNSVVCNTRQTRDSASVSGSDFAKDLKDTINKPVGDICTAGFNPEIKTRFISYESGPLVFTIMPTDEDAQLQEGCGTNFEQIIEECIAKKDLWGGSILTGGLLYQIYNHDVFGTGFNEWVPQRMK
jgi:hypothetical protein